MTHTILCFGDAGTGKSEIIRRQGGDVEITQDSKSDIKTYTVANGDRVVDASGLPDTKADANTPDAHTHGPHLQSLRDFFSQHDIRFIHGIQWHILPVTPVSRRLEREARFIHDLVGEDGWKNVVILVLASCTFATVTAVQDVYKKYTPGTSPVVRGVVLDSSGRPPRNCVSLINGDAQKNAKTLADLGHSSDPIEVCAVGQEHVKGSTQGDHRTYGARHADIGFKHSREVVTYDHSGTPIAHEHTIDKETQDVWSKASKFAIHAAMAVAQPASIPIAVAAVLKEFNGNTDKKPPCKRGTSCDGQAAVCYYVWDQCGCELEGGKDPKEAGRGGCSKETRKCGDCGKSMDEQGCIGFCRRCKLHQDDEDFAMRGCAFVDVKRDVRRMD